MLKGGEDPSFIARRLVRCAAEDVGLGDPAALPLAVAAFQVRKRGSRTIGFNKLKYVWLVWICGLKIIIKDNFLYAKKASLFLYFFELVNSKTTFNELAL